MILTKIHMCFDASPFMHGTKRSYKLFFSNLFVIMNLHILVIYIYIYYTHSNVQREPSKMFQNFGSLFLLRKYWKLCSFNWFCFLSIKNTSLTSCTWIHDQLAAVAIHIRTHTKIFQMIIISGLSLIKKLFYSLHINLYKYQQHAFYRFALGWWAQ